MIRDNIIRLREQVKNACLQAERDYSEVTIVAIAKNRTPEQIGEVIGEGIADIGENKVQETLLKYKDKRYALCDMPIRWHMVGHLQSNKVKAAVKIFNLIHSVDSMHLATEIDKQAAKINKIQDILLQVNTSGEETKFGLKPDKVVEVIKEISQLRNIAVKGLMTIAPVVDNPQKTRPCFKGLRELLLKINGLRITGCELGVLSMGMTDDFEIAIREGANMLRIGRAIFGG